MKVTVYCINQGTPAQYYGLKNLEDNQVLHYAPNHWKTKAGAIRWAEKNGLEVQPEKADYEAVLAQIVELPREAQDSFFENLREKISPADFEILQKAVALYDMHTNPAKYEAIKNAVGEKLYEELTR